MNLLLIRQSEIFDKRAVRVSDSRLLHLATVLKAHVGDVIRIGMLDGPIGKARVTSINADEAILQILELQDLPAVTTDIDLILAIPRPKTLRKVLITCAMMSVRSLHLIRANRTEKSYLLSPLLQPEEYEQYLLDGLAQGKLTRLPKIQVHTLFRPFVEDTLPTLPDYPDAAKLLSDLVPSQSLDQALGSGVPKQVMLAIGPEGGWVPFERDLLQKAGFMSCNLGPWVLRVETAVAVALGQVELIRSIRERSG